ncbi:MAG: nuclear transport factor 2 family protein [Candidatus Rokuibacteriota bacterium]
MSDPHAEVEEANRRFYRAFEALDLGEMRFTIADVQVTMQNETACVTCTENILSQVGGRVAVTSVLATNIFTHGPDGWLMVHHHASHILGGGAQP